MNGIVEMLRHIVIIKVDSLKMFSNKNSSVHSPLSRFTQEGIFQGIYPGDIYHINVIEMAKLYLTDYIGL